MLYAFVVIEHGTRRLAHVNATANPTANWTLQQLREVIGDNDGRNKYLIHDRDRIFAKHLDDSIRALGCRSTAVSDCESQSELDLRTRDRDDTKGVPRLDDPDV